MAMDARTTVEAESDFLLFLVEWGLRLRLLEDYRYPCLPSCLPRIPTPLADRRLEPMVDHLSEGLAVVRVVLDTHAAVAVLPLPNGLDPPEFEGILLGLEEKCHLDQLVYVVFVPRVAEVLVDSNPPPMMMIWMKMKRTNLKNWTNLMRILKMTVSFRFQAGVRLVVLVVPLGHRRI